MAIHLTPIPLKITDAGKYALGLLRALAEYDKKNHYWIFVKEDQAK